MDIKYSDRSNRFVIDCAFHENSLIAPLPEKRFQKRSKVWHAPALSRNSRFLLDNLSEYMSDKAMQVAKDSVDRATIKRRPFPGWYEPVHPPSELQQRGLDYIWGLNDWALYMWMGTGKSKMAIDYAAARMIQEDIDTLLVMCPSGVAPVWMRDEIEKHMPIEVEVMDFRSLTPARCRKMIDAATRTRRLVCVAAYESIQQKVHAGQAYDTLAQILSKRKYGLICDESHRVKNHQTVTAQNVESLAQGAVFKGIQSGTPYPTGFTDLYEQYRILDPNIIGLDNYYAFRNRYAIMGGYENKEIVGYQNTEELLRLVSPYTYQVSEEEASRSLPERNYSTVYVQMSKEQQRVYKELDRNRSTTLEVDTGQSISMQVDQILQKYTALQQVCAGFVAYDDEQEDEVTRRTSWIMEPKQNPKIQELQRILRDHPDQQVIVWTRFKNEIAQIMEVFPDAAQYHGTIPRDQRDREVDRFRSGEARLFVSNETGQEGLTLNEAYLVVYMSNSFKYTQRVQTEKRNHRRGQTRPVHYIDLVHEGTVDEAVIESLRQKKDMASYIESQLQQA